MKRPVRPGAVLLVVAAMAAGAVAVASLGVRLRGGERRLAAGRSQRVLELEPARVTALSISAGRGGAARRLVRGAGGWRLAAPVDAPADGAVVARLLEGLAALERRATVAAPGASPGRLRAYGLDAPEALLELALDDGRSLSLAFGSGTGEDGAMFVQPGSGEVVLVAADARRALLPTLSELAAAPGDRAGQAPGGPRP